MHSRLALLALLGAARSIPLAYEDGERSTAALEEELRAVKEQNRALKQAAVNARAGGLTTAPSPGMASAHEPLEPSASLERAPAAPAAPSIVDYGAAGHGSLSDLERENKITELIFGVDSFPHWDGDTCLVGAPAQFGGECKYTPSGSFVVPAMLKTAMHHMGLKECSSAAQCTCSGCEELNARRVEGSSIDVSFHTPSKWVKQMNEPDLWYKKLSSVQREVAELNDKLQAARQAYEAAAGDAHKARKAQIDINRLQTKQDKFQAQANEYQVEYNRLTTIREKHEQLPIWDATGLYASGRFQYQTGCMVKAGNDCGCYLVDTLIGERDRATCTKGEWLQGNTFDLGYGTFEANRVFEIKILQLEIGDGKSAQDKEKLRHETNIYVRGRPSTCDVGPQKELPCEETRQTSMRFGMNNPNDGYTADSLKANWAGDSSSSFVVYIPSPGEVPHFCYNLLVVDTDNLDSRSYFWRKLNPFAESDRVVASLCVKGGEAQDDDAKQQVFRVDCAPVRAFPLTTLCVLPALRCSVSTARATRSSTACARKAERAMTHSFGRRRR